MIMCEKLNADVVSTRVHFNQGMLWGGTFMIEMCPQILVSMPPSRDVKVALHFISLQTAIDPTRVGDITPSQGGTLGELPARIPTHLAQDMPHMDVLLLRQQPSRILLVERLVLVDPRGDLAVDLVHPQLPAGGLAVQHLARQDAVARRVLDVDAHVVAGHAHHQVQVQLQLARHALLDAEVLRLRAAEPRPQLGDAQHRAEHQQRHRPLSAASAG